MMLRLAAVSAVVLFSLAGCDRAKAPPQPTAEAETAAPVAPAETAESPGAASGDMGATSPASAGTAPAFAALYPGARIDGAPLTADGAAGDNPDGPSLQVVAAPGPDGATSVHMNWSAGS